MYHQNRHQNRPTRYPASLKTIASTDLPALAPTGRWPQRLKTLAGEHPALIACTTDLHEEIARDPVRFAGPEMGPSLGYLEGPSGRVQLRNCTRCGSTVGERPPLEHEPTGVQCRRCLRPVHPGACRG